jgi:hypothetical protein
MRIPLNAHPEVSSGVIPKPRVFTGGARDLARIGSAARLACPEALP